MAFYVRLANVCALLCHRVTCLTNVSWDVEMSDSSEKTKRQQAAEAGGKFLRQEGFKSATNSACEQVGWILKARNSYPDESDHYFGGVLHDEIIGLLNSPELHTKNVLRIAIAALVSEQAWFWRKNYTANFNKTFFGFPVKNPLAESYLVWHHFDQLDSFGQTGLGTLESLRAISNQKIHVPTLMFDLCHMLIKLEEGKISLNKFESNYSCNITNPGETSPYKVFDIDTDKPYILKDDFVVELKKWYGFKISLNAIPNRLEWIASGNGEDYHQVHMSVSQLNIGNNDSGSILGKNQFFTVTDDSLIALPEIISFRLVNTSRQEINNKNLSVLRGLATNVSLLESDAEEKFKGQAKLHFIPHSNYDGVKYPDSLDFQVALDDLIFGKFISLLKDGLIKSLHLDIAFSIPSVFASSDSYHGWPNVIFFHKYFEATGKINDISIEYKIN